MNRQSSISKFVRGLFAENIKNSASLAVERLLQVFHEHGIEITQIPRLLPGIVLHDLQSPELFIKVLSPAIFDQVAELFGIRVEYLEGIDDRIYDYLGTYKQPTILLDCLRQFYNQLQWQEVNIAPLRILTTAGKLDHQDQFDHQLVPILVEPIAALGDEVIYRYHVYQDGFSWTHAPARIELKAIARTIFNALGRVIPLYAVKPQEMEALLEGRLIPHALLNRPLITNPSLEDYVLEPDKSVVAKEWDELPVVFEYMKEMRLNTYDFHVESNPGWTNTQQPSEAQASEVPPKQVSCEGKKQRLKRQFQDAALVVWEKTRVGGKYLDIKVIANHLEVVAALEGEERKFETLCVWLGEVDPRPTSDKRGRRRKNNAGLTEPEKR